MKAYLKLANGELFEGQAMGASGMSIGEVVFNTGMAGYQEVLTDPSYFGQMVTMTYPLIGNYGVNTPDSESEHPWVKGFIVRELCEYPSNWRCEENLNSYLKRYGIIGIYGIDTRHLTRILRSNGVMNGVLWTEDIQLPNDIMEQVKNYQVRQAVKSVTHAQAIEHHGSEKGYKIALMDFSVKENIVRCLCACGCDVTVLPAATGADEIINGGYDGIMLTNGPGDPEENTEIIKNVKKLLESGLPIFGICLGHQIVALASGAKTGKMKFGHRGGNQPVKDLKKDRTYITSQNHGYAVLAETVNQDEVEISHINLNDGTVEGLRFKNKPVFTVQFHPEGCPGPQDTNGLFNEFMDLIAKTKGDVR